MTIYFWLISLYPAFSTLDNLILWVLSILWIKNMENININFIADCEVEKELTIERVRQFKHILLYYLDFLQKQKVTSGYTHLGMCKWKYMY